MLNISKNPLNKQVSLDRYSSLAKVENKTYYKVFNKLSLLFLLVLIVMLFLPWTQNISGYGKVTTLMPSQRPQSIQSQIPGESNNG